MQFVIRVHRLLKPGSGLVYFGPNTQSSLSVVCLGGLRAESLCLDDETTHDHEPDRNNGPTMRDTRTMSPLPEVPQFGALLRKHIQSVPHDALPAFLAGLERSAAERYRGWANEIPAHADDLLGCATSEDRIAEIVTGLFPISSELQAQVDKALPAAVALYYDVFAPYTPTEQLYLQSEAEIQGSQAWVRMSEQITDEATLASLRECTALELRSSVAAKAVLDALGSTTI